MQGLDGGKDSMDIAMLILGRLFQSINVESIIFMLTSPAALMRLRACVGLESRPVHCRTQLFSNQFVSYHHRWTGCVRIGTLASAAEDRRHFTGLWKLPIAIERLKHTEPAHT